MINTKMMALWLASVMLLPSYVVAGHHETHEMSPKDVVAAAYATFAAGDTDAWASPQRY